MVAPKFLSRSNILMAICPRMPTVLSTLRRHAFTVTSGLQRWWYRTVHGMDLGRGLKLSRSAKLDKTNPKGIHIGDWTAITFDAAILSHDMQTNRHVDTWIGSHCFIGAKAIIMPGVRVGDHAIVGAGSVVMTDVPPNSIVSGNPAKVVRSGIVTGRWGITDQRFLDKEAREGRPAADPAMAPVAPSSALPKLPRADLLALLACERADLVQADLSQDFAALGLDSFALINLRIGLEARVGRPIADSAWLTLRTPADLLAGEGEQPSLPPVAAPPIPARPSSTPEPHRPTATGVRRSRTLPEGPRAFPAGEWRDYRINLPHMAMRGLGEPWLMRELGDIHWSALLRELETTASELSDSNGDRLYATFTRIRWRSDVPLTSYQESEAFDLETRVERYGAGMFFSRVKGNGARGTLDAEVMTTFAKFGEAGANTSLLKGQPVIPPGCAIPAVPALPPFAADYRALRASDFGPSVFECDYEQQPPHDINGVGLLYFATYPTIFELCLMRHGGRRLLTGFSLVERDICYFANADPDEVLRFRLHDLSEDEEGLSYRATLSRTSDGKTMAMATARKRAINLPPPGTPVVPGN